jgi:polysaccharide biosynthesis transport protein
MGRFSSAVRRRRVVIVAALLAGLMGAAFVAALQPRVYEAWAVASVSGPAPTVEHMGPGIASRTAATYAEVATSPTVLDPVIDRLRLHSTDAALASQIHASADRGTSFIRIAVDGGSPTSAATIANAVVDQLGVASTRLNPESGANVTRVTTVRVARPAADPLTPNIPIDLALGLLAGLVVAVVLVATLEGRRRGPSGGAA